MEKQGILTQCHQTFSANYHGLWIISLGWSEILLSTSDFRHHSLGEISLDFFINRGFCCLQQSQYSSIQLFKLLGSLHIHYLVNIYFCIFLFVCFGLPPVNFFWSCFWYCFFPFFQESILLLSIIASTFWPLLSFQLFHTRQLWEKFSFEQSKFSLQGEIYRDISKKHDIG